MDTDHRGALARFLLEKHRDPVVVLSADGSVVASNGSAKRLGAEITQLFEQPETDAYFARFLDDVRSAGEAYTIVASQDGRVHRLEGAAVDGWSIIVFREISSAHRRELELEQLRACATLGALTTHLVHDLNNLLTPVVMASSRLARELGDGDAGVMASVIHSSATLATRLAQDVLAIARPRPPLLERLDPSEVVIGMQRLLEQLVGEGGELVLDLDGAGDALFDRRRLEHGLLEAVVACRDSTRAPRRLTVTSRTVDEDGRSRVVVRAVDSQRGPLFETSFDRELACDQLGT